MYTRGYVVHVVRCSISMFKVNNLSNELFVDLFKETFSTHVSHVK